MPSLLQCAFMSEHIPGLTLGEDFYREAAKPILDSRFPHLSYSSALIGWSSEVLGYDDLRSTDHNWGPRFLLFLSATDHERYTDQVSAALSEALPLEFRGYPTNFGVSVQGDQRAMERAFTGPVHHKIDIDTLEAYFRRYLGYDLTREPTAVDWLAFSEHKLLAVTSGRVFHDGLSKLEDIRGKLTYYPRDVWLYILASQWAKISGEEAFAGRCAEVGDELGSMMIAARQVKSLMQLCFLMEKVYAPYSKWFGSAFSRLSCGPELGPILKSVALSGSWEERQKHLSEAYEFVARMHNSLGVTGQMRESVELHGRPYYVIRAGLFAAAIWKSVEKEEVCQLPFPLGSVNQLVDSTEILSNLELCERLKSVYG
jgi:hypothetical protein